MSQPTILLVGDEDTGALSAKRQLEQWDYQVSTVTQSGREAIQRADRTQPDLVVIDLELQGEMPGPELAEAMKMRFDIPVVCLVARPDDERLRCGGATAPFSYVLKSSDWRELQLAVRSALHTHCLERMLRETEEAKRALIERSSDGVVIIQDLCIREANPRIADMLGCSVNDLVGAPIIDYVHPEDQGKVVDRYERRMSGEEVPETYAVKLKRKDGGDILAQVSAGITTYEGQPADLALVRDVTDRRQLEEEVRRRQLYLEGVLQSAPDAIVTLNAERRVSEWNPGAEELFGYSSEEAVGRDLDELIAEPDAEMLEEATAFTGRVLAGAAVPRVETRRYRKDGTPVDVILGGAPIRIGDESVGAVASYTDITERKRAEEALRRRTEQLEALRHVGLDIVSELNLDELLRSIVSRAIELVDATAGGFDFYRSDQDVLEFSIDIGYDELPDDATISRGEGLAGRVWQTGQSIVVDDYAAWDGRSRAWTGLIGHAAEIGVPVQWGDQFLGVLEVRADAPGGLSQEDALLLELFATQAAIAIRNAQMYEETQQRIAQLETLQSISTAVIGQLNLEELLESIVEQGCRLLNVGGGSLYLVDGAGDELEQVVSYGYQRDHTGSTLAPGEGTAGESWGRGAPFVVDDYRRWEGRAAEWEDEELTASLAVPLRHRDEVIGTLGFDAIAQPRVFDEGDIWLTTLFANQAAIAIENARLYEETTHRLAETEALRQVMRAAASTLDLDELLARSLQVIHEALGIEHVSFALPDDSEKCMVVHPSWIGRSAPAEGVLRLSLDASVVGQVYMSGESVLIKDTNENAHGFDYGPGMRAAVAVPVSVGHQVMGVLHAESSEPDALDENTLHTFQVIAAQMAAAMENAKLYEESRRRLRETNSLLEVSHDVVSTLDLDEVLQRVIKAAIEAIGPAEKGMLHLFDQERGELVPRASIGFAPETIEAAHFAPGEGYTGWVFARQQPLIVGDVKADPRTKPIDLPEVEEEKSALCVPLTFGGEVMGTLTLDNVTRLEAFDQAHLDLLSIFASQAAAAIRNARLHSETELRASRLRAVNRIARRASSSLRLDDLIEALYEEIQSAFNADAFFLALYDREQRQLDYRLLVDKGVREPPLRRSMSPGLTASVVTHGEPLLIRDYEHERDDLPPAEAWGTEEATHSWLGVPMRVGEQVVGVISVQAYRPFAYGDEDQQMLSTIADQVAMALEKTRLYEESQRRANQATLLYEAGRHVSSELEPDALLDTIVSAVRDAFDYHNVILLLLDEADEAGGHSPGGENLRMQSIAGAYVDTLPPDLTLAIGEGMIGYAATTGETQLSNDVSTDPHYVQKGEEDTRSELVVPIKSGDRVIGVLDLQDDELGAFDSLDVTTMETLTSQIAGAIENARLFQAERERSAQLATVSKVTESITSTLDPDEVLHRTVEMITEALGYYYVSIMLVDEVSDHLAFKAGAGGLAGETPLDFHQPIGEGMIGWVAERGETLLANDVSQEPLYIPAYLPQTKSELDVPLKYRGEVIGVLDLQSTERNAFNEHDVLAMEALAGHVAAAIENARLFDVASRRVAELRAVRQASLQLTSTLELEPVLETILEHALDLASADDAHVFLYDGDELSFGAAMWNGRRQDEPFDTIRPDGLTYTVAREGERIVVSNAATDPLFEDRRWDGAIVGMPLTTGEDVQGVMNVAYQCPHDFSEEELWVLDLLADQAAIAIRNARLYHEAQDRALEQETLRRAALALTTALERDEVVERVLAQLQEVVPYDTASVQLLQNDRLEIVGGRGFPNLEELLGVTFDVTEGENPNGMAIRNRQPVILNDAGASYGEFSRAPHAEAKIRSWLGVPMLVGDRVIGMITLDKQEPGFYTDEHASLAEAFAAQAGVAIENAQLHQETVRQLAETEVLRETMLAAASSLDFDQVLARTAEVLGRAMGVEYLGFMLPEQDPSSGETIMVSHPCVLGFNPPEDGYRFAVASCLTGQVYQTGEAKILSDVREADVYTVAASDVRSELAVPVKVGDEVAAVLNLESSRADAFGEQDLAFYTAIAGQLGIAMENARLFEAEREQRQLSEALGKAAVAVSGTLELEQVLDHILEQVARVVPGDSFNIMLIEDDEARVVRWRGYDRVGAAQEISRRTISISESPHWMHMSRTGQSLIIHDTQLDPDWNDRWGWGWLRSYVAAPIQVGDTVVGFLNVDGTKVGQFSPHDADRLETFASHAATAIENARLYERLRDHAEMLEARVVQRTAQLQTQYARLEAVLDSTLNGIVVMGPDSELSLVNPVAQEWLTQTLSPKEAELLRDTIEDLAERAEQNPEEVLELTGLDLQLRAATIQELGREKAAAVVAIHDISHLKALDRMRSRFVSNVSHELRTPIATIKLFVHLMQKQPEKWREYLEPLAQEAEHQAKLVEDILEISRVDAGRLEINPERLNLKELVEIVMSGTETRARERGLRLQRTADPTAPEPVSMVDAKRMTQVLDNLINNALRYTSEGGEITISTGTREANGRRWATVTVADTGMGIPEDELPHVFDRFFRGEKPRTLQISGTGLGLAIVKEIVELHGGQVTVESEVGKGSSFTVWLPLTKGGPSSD